MPSETTYQAFRCEGCIFVMYQTGNDMPQQLVAFRQPRHLFVHNSRLVGLYDPSDTVVPLTDTPGHDAEQVLAAINNAVESDTPLPALSRRELSALVMLSMLAVLVLKIWHLC